MWQQYPYVIVCALAGIAMVAVAWRHVRLRQWLLFCIITTAVEKALKIDHDKARVRLLQDEHFQMMRSNPNAAVRERFESYIK